MVEPTAAIVPREVGRAVAPPGEAAFGGGHEPAADVDPVVRLAKPGQRLDLDRRVADDLEQRLVAPDVAFERRHVEVADDDGWFGKAFRPASHPTEEIELLAELRVLFAVGDIAAGGHIDVLEADPALQPDADVTRLAIVLPVVLAMIFQRRTAED